MAGLPDLVAVTRDGDVLSAHFAAGGSSAQPSLIEVQAAIDEAEQRLTEAGHRCDRLRFAQSQLEEQQRDASAAVEETLARLHESDAAMAAVAEQLGQLGSTARSAAEENERLAQAITRAEQARDSDISGLAELEHRLELAETAEEVEPDPAERDRLTAEARQSRDAEMEARLALRTLEERVRALAGRADALRKAATAQRQAQARELARRARVRREAETAAAVHAAAGFLAGAVERSLAQAGVERTAAEAARTEAEAALTAARASVRSLGTGVRDAGRRGPPGRDGPGRAADAGGGADREGAGRAGPGGRGAGGRVRAGPARADRRRRTGSRGSRCRSSASSSRSGCGPPSGTCRCSAG